jgi:hypothetical protein
MSSGKKRHEQERRARLRRRREQEAIAAAGIRGLGGVIDDKAHHLANLAMITQAIKNEWDIPEAIRPKLVPEAALLYFNRDLGVRERLQAGKLILAANGQNIKGRQIEKEEPPQGNTNVMVFGNIDLSKMNLEELRQLRDLRNRLAGRPESSANGNGTGQAAG